MIAESTGMNGALVNYHFGSKASLYKDSWQFAKTMAEEKYPLYTENAKHETPFDVLRGVIYADILSRADDENYANHFALNELSEETGFLPDVMQWSFFRVREAIRETVRTILAGKVPDVMAETVAMMIFSTCTLPLRKMEEMEGFKAYNFSAEDRAGSVCSFAFAGIRTVLAGSSAQ